MNMEGGMSNMDAAAPVSAQQAAPPPPSVPFSAGVNRSQVHVRVDFALREQ